MLQKSASMVSQEPEVVARKYAALRLVFLQLAVVKTQGLNLAELAAK
jgi:hypothetical protein